MKQRSRIFKIKGTLQYYDWGKIGNESLVAQLYNQDTGSLILPNKPYAELWFGTHPNGPSLILFDDGRTESLHEHIQKDPQNILGREVAHYWNNTLPFLFKVLSINKPLSIQAHPDKLLAQKLFKQNPQVYKDPNHKPEVACALTTMHALCQFRPLEQIQHFISTVPELRTVIGESNVIEFETKLRSFKDDKSVKEALQRIFHLLMTADPKLVKNELDRLVSRLKEQTDHFSKTLLRVHSEFPGDVGVFCLYFMNLLTLQPDEAIFLEPNEPHAYLLGDCVECMACSDNVVRAGLTPKLKDVETLVQMLTFNPQQPHIHSGTLFELAPGCTERVYCLKSIEEFQISKISVQSNLKNIVFENSNSASIWLIFQGNGTLKEMEGDTVVELKRGTALFVYANTKLTISSSNDPLTIWKVTVNSQFFTNSQHLNNLTQ